MTNTYVETVSDGYIVLTAEFVHSDKNIFCGMRPCVFDRRVGGRHPCRSRSFGDNLLALRVPRHS